jgi:hypothetical protein
MKSQPGYSHPPNEAREQNVMAQEKAFLRKFQYLRTVDELCSSWKGIGISGGGIRAATFGLGAIQAFAAARLLSRVDHLNFVLRVAACRPNSW